MSIRDWWTFGIVLLFTSLSCWWCINITTPMPIYATISGVLGALLVIGWRTIYKPFWLVLASMLWYSSYWALRDGLTGFYAPQSYFDNWMSLAPTMIALLYYSEKLTWQWVVSILCIHTIWVAAWPDTDNELLAFLALVAFGQNQRTVAERAVLVTFFWYQCYIASTKYMANYYVDRDLIYFIALTPFLASLIFKYISRINYGR